MYERLDKKVRAERDDRRLRAAGVRRKIADLNLDKWLKDVARAFHGHVAHGAVGDLDDWPDLVGRVSTVHLPDRKTAGGHYSRWFKFAIVNDGKRTWFKILYNAGECCELPVEGLNSERMEDALVVASRFPIEWREKGLWEAWEEIGRRDW